MPDLYATITEVDPEVQGAYLPDPRPRPRSRTGSITFASLIALKPD